MHDEPIIDVIFNLCRGGHSESKSVRMPLLMPWMNSVSVSMQMETYENPSYKNVIKVVTKNCNDII